MSAARNGHTNAVLALLADGADVNAKDSNGWTALMSAAASGHVDTLGALLAKGADVNAKDKSGWTALIVAADSGHRDSVLALLKKGADASARDRNGDTALSLAEKHKHPQVIAVLKRPLLVSQSKPPQKAVSNKPGASLPATPGTASAPATQPALPNAPAAGRPSLVQQLLDAAQSGDIVAVQSLLKQGADVNGRGGYGSTPLMSAALTGHTEIARLLLDKGAAVDAHGNTGRTALMEAAVEGYTDTVRLLLEKGADVNAKDEEGWTPLFWAAFSKRTDVVRALLEKGANVNAKNKYEDTPLIRAAYGGDTATVNVLLQHGADLNARDDMGRTALMEASRQGHADTVRALLDKGANVELRDRDGNTALSLAEKYNYPNVIVLLKKRPAVPPIASPEKTTTSRPDASPSVNVTNVPPITTGVSRKDENQQADACFRIGWNMQMVEAWWPETSELAGGWALGIQQDLQKVGAPSDLVELAMQAEKRLKSLKKENTDAVAHLVHDLRTRLDEFYNKHQEKKFFYTAGGFTYRLDLLGEDLAKPSKGSAKVGDHRREILALATAITEQCLVTMHCKELALIYFSDAAAILKKPQLTLADGTALVKDAGEIELALSGEER